MSNYNNKSFTTSDGFERSFTASLGYSQSTEATELSDYGNTVAAVRQIHTTNEYNVLRGVGYAGDKAANPNPGTENYGGAFIQTGGPYYVSPAQDRSAYEDPWSHLLHQFDPCPANRRSTATRPGLLAQQPFAVYNVQEPFAPPLPNVSDDWLRQQYASSTPNQGQAPFSTLQPSSSSLSSGQPPVAIQRLPSSHSSASSPPTSQENEPRYWCEEPDCNVGCKRSKDLERHYRTRHGECASGPFWRCQVRDCGYWNYSSRRDKAEQHCREKHNTPHCRQRHTHADHRCYPLYSVDDVGPQNHQAKVSTTGKQTRRRKTPVT